MKEQKNINFLGLIAKPYVEKISNVVEKVILTDLKEIAEKKGDYKQSIRALPVFAIRIFQMSNGVIDLILAENIYSAKTLLRPLIEHSFKISFLTKKATKENSAEVFKDYYLFCDLAEELQYQKSLDYKSQLLFEKESDEKAFLDLIKNKPEIQKYSKRKIFEKANEFTFRNIFKFLNENDDIEYKNVENDFVKQGYEAYAMIGAIYSDLSSFIHGGPFAEPYVFPSSKEDEDNYEILNVIENVMIMHFYANLSILEFWNSIIPNKYDYAIKEINELMLEYYEKV
tara:strand:+ start:57 stop:911 length:855 start_codon:yes stop_codon:yes gene_type:complete